MNFLTLTSLTLHSSSYINVIDLNDFFNLLYDVSSISGLNFMTINIVVVEMGVYEKKHVLFIWNIIQWNLPMKSLVSH